jgi:hypothetical protein
MFEKNEASKG